LLQDGIIDPAGVPPTFVKLILENFIETVPPGLRKSFDWGIKGSGVFS
jgi:hypothetical protein